MKRYKYFLSALVVAGSFFACSPDDIEGVNEAGVPQASAFESYVKIDVDQELNQVSLTLDAPEVYPIWTITLPNGKEEKTTVNGYTKIYVNSGDYTVNLKVGNRNGISDGSYTTTFHLDNTLIDFGKYTTLLGKGKWHMANKEKGHLACGESGSDGTNWWSGDPDCKANEGLYDNELSFSADFKYTFEPGAHGTIYANKGVTIWPDYRNPDEDFNVPVEFQESEYGLETEGDDLYITFPKGTYFPYIANDYIWNTPRYKVINMSGKKMTLLIDEPGVIAWQYILTTENTVERAFTGFTYDQPDNLWKKHANATFASLYYAHGGSWDGLPDYEHSEENDVYTVKLPSATDMQWQAQYCINTELNSNIIVPGNKYDFSCKVLSNTDIPGMTLKLTSQTDDPSLVNNQNGPLAVIPAFEETVVYFTELEAPSIDGNYKFVFDFGGNPENTEVVIKEIVVIDHSKNTELDLLPKDEPGTDIVPGTVIWAGVDDPANLMTKGELSLASTWFANDGWAELGNQPTVEINGRNAKITVNEANGGSQWQGQVHLNTKVAIEEGKAYDFAIVLNPSQDIAGATVKPHPNGDDGHFFSEGRHDLAAYDNNKVTYVNFVSDFSTDNLVLSLDFPSCAAGATIEVKDIIVQEHNEAAAGGSSWVDEGSADNLMNTGALALASTWFATDGWAELGNQPTVNINGNTAKIIVNEANGGSQWQGQVHLNTGVAIAEGTTYDFAIVLNPSQDIAGATVKPHPNGDDGHFFSEGRHDLAAYDDNRVTYENFTADFSTDNLVITLDFPSCAAGTEIEVKGIIIQVHKAGGNGGGSAAAPFDYNSADNLWKTATVKNAGIYYAPNWGQIADFENSVTNQKITVNLPEATFGEWQAQLPVLTDLDKNIISADKKYDFQCKITASKDHPGMTLKLVEEGPNSTPGSLGINYDSNAIFYQPGVALPAYEEVVVTLTGMQGVALQDNPLKLVLDFGNNAAGTEVEICDIILREAK